MDWEKGRICRQCKHDLCTGSMRAVEQSSLVLVGNSLDVCSLDLQTHNVTMRCETCTPRMVDDPSKFNDEAKYQRKHTSAIEIVPADTTQGIVFHFNRESFHMPALYNDRHHPVCIPHCLHDKKGNTFVISLVGSFSCVSGIPHWKLFVYDKYQRSQELRIDRGWHELNDDVLGPAKNQAIQDHITAAMAIYVRATPQMIQVIESRIPLTSLVGNSTQFPYHRQRGNDDAEDNRAAQLTSFQHGQVLHNDKINGLKFEILKLGNELAKENDTGNINHINEVLAVLKQKLRMAEADASLYEDEAAKASANKERMEARENLKTAREKLEAARDERRMIDKPSHPKKHQAASNKVNKAKNALRKVVESDYTLTDNDRADIEELLVDSEQSAYDSEQSAYESDNGSVNDKGATMKALHLIQGLFENTSIDHVSDEANEVALQFTSTIAALCGDPSFNIIDAEKSVDSYDKVFKAYSKSKLQSTDCGMAVVLVMVREIPKDCIYASKTKRTRWWYGDKDTEPHPLYLKLAEHVHQDKYEPDDVTDVVLKYTLTGDIAYTSYKDLVRLRWHDDNKVVWSECKKRIDTIHRHLKFPGMMDLTCEYKQIERKNYGDANLSQKETLRILMPIYEKRVNQLAEEAAHGRTLTRGSEARAWAGGRGGQTRGRGSGNPRLAASQHARTQDNDSDASPTRPLDGSSSSDNSDEDDLFGDDDDDDDSDGEKKQAKKQSKKEKEKKKKKKKKKEKEKEGIDDKDDDSAEGMTYALYFSAVQGKSYCKAGMMSASGPLWYSKNASRYFCADPRGWVKQRYYKIHPRLLTASHKSNIEILKNLELLGRIFFNHYHPFNIDLTGTRVHPKISSLLLLGVKY